jgi:uncharacterized protein (DUF1499 family)
VGVSVGAILTGLAVMQRSPTSTAEKFGFGVLMGWSVLLLGVRLATLTPTPVYLHGFPASISKAEGCTRVALDKPHRGKGLAVPFFAASPKAVKKHVLEYFASDSTTTVFVNTDSYLYLNALTAGMGFPDNIAVRIGSRDGSTYVEAMAELRIGRGDLFKNEQRMQRFYAHLETIRPQIEREAKKTS